MAQTDQTSAAHDNPLVQQRAGSSFRFFRKAGSTTLVIFFSGVGKGDGKFEFWNTGRTVSENLLFLNDGRTHWYQSGIAGVGDSVDAAADAISRLCSTFRIDNVVTVGSSMGGYGAILYAWKLKARALAFGTDTILKSPASFSERVMARDAPLIFPDLLPLVREAGTTVQLYAGEMEILDIIAARRLMSAPSVSVTTIRGVDHASARYVHENMGLTEILRCFLDGQALPAISDAGTILSQPHLVDLLYDAELALRAEDWKRCAAACKKALASFPANDVASYLMGQTLCGASAASDALPYFSRIVSSYPNFAGGQAWYGIALRKARQPEAAINQLSMVVERWPKTYRAYYNLALALDAQGRRDEAIAHASRAVEIRPNRRRYVALLDSLKRPPRPESRLLKAGSILKSAFRLARPN